MIVGVVGKPNVGKSTFFKSLTLADAEIAGFPFTTIKANVGVGYVRSPCPHKDFGLSECNPSNGVCRGGVRFTPIKLVDVAGLVPGAHEGKGLGNQFLDDLRQANVLIHVVDISGRTNEKGEPTKDHDPEADIKFLENEIDLWFTSVIKKNLGKILSKLRHGGGDFVKELSQNLAGLGISEVCVKKSLHDASLAGKTDLSDEEVSLFAVELRKNSLPIVVAANKIDLDSNANFERLKSKFELTAVCAEGELALREAEHDGLIKYTSGEESFEVLGSLSEKQNAGLDFLSRNILKKHKGTGVAKVLEDAVFSVLEQIVVYPVESESKFSDKNGNVLPHSHLIIAGSNALDLAYLVHTDLGEKFIGAVDCRTHMKVGRDHVLKDGDVIKIISGR